MASYEGYKARDKEVGICPMWQSNPQQFANDMEEAYEAVKSRPALVLRDSTGIYSKLNCKVVTLAEASKSTAKPVVQLNKNNTVLNVYESAAEAARQIKLDSSKINAVCNGKRNSHGGFKWKFKNTFMI